MNIPESLWVLSLDPEPQDGNDGQLRMVHMSHADGEQYVAVFSDEQLALDWIKDNAPKNEVLRPIQWRDRDHIIRNLKELLNHGTTHLCRV
jgi:hypothetical protein